MLPLTLNTNEIKDQTGTEVEFQRLSTSERQLIFGKIGESLAYPQRLMCAHQEIGEGLAKRRRSVVRIEYSAAGAVDATKPIKCIGQITMDIPIGNMTVTNLANSVAAYLMSFLASKGASTTILYDGTGYGAEVLINGSL